MTKLGGNVNGYHIDEVDFTPGCQDSSIKQFLVHTLLKTLSSGEMSPCSVDRTFAPASVNMRLTFDKDGRNTRPVFTVSN
ncbi:hypothetical protein TSMEX_000131 [Taenia solium]|eukprot:TsM_000785900 transcript=TsM_000785900 gene=TsM_000785900